MHPLRTELAKNLKAMWWAVTRPCFLATAGAEVLALVLAQLIGGHDAVVAVGLVGGATLVIAFRLSATARVSSVFDRRSDIAQAEAAPERTAMQRDLGSKRIVTSVGVVGGALALLAMWRLRRRRVRR